MEPRFLIRFQYQPGGILIQPTSVPGVHLLQHIFVKHLAGTRVIQTFSEGYKLGENTLCPWRTHSLLSKNKIEISISKIHDSFCWERYKGLRREREDEVSFKERHLTCDAKLRFHQRETGKRLASLAEGLSLARMGKYTVTKKGKSPNVTGLSSTFTFSCHVISCP